MKIALITDCVREKPTGIGNYAKNFIENLLKIEKKNEYFFVDYEKNDFNRKRLVVIKNIFHNFPGRTYLWTNILPLTIKEKKIDFIFNLSGNTHLFTYRQKEFFWVYDLSSVIFPLYHTWWRSLINKLLFRRNLNKANKIVAISKNTKKDLIHYFKIPEDKILIIYPTLPEKAKIETQPKVPIKIPYILYFGTLEPRKNIASIVMALYKLKIRNKFSYSLVIAGKEGWSYDEIYKLVDRLGLKNEVIFTGYVTEEEKRYLFMHAKLFVYPSYYEGFGIPTIEAMSYGCPVITSYVSSLPEACGNAAYYVSPYSIEDITKGIKKVLTDDEMRKKMIDNGLKQAKKFSREKLNNQTLKILEEIRNG